MLKRKEYRYECEDYKIINPNAELSKEISDELKKYSNKDGETDYDNPKLNLFLFTKLVKSDNIDFQFDKYSLGSFKELLEEPAEEINNIAYEVADILSDIILNTLKAYKLQLKNMNINVLQAEIINETNKIGQDIVEKKEEVEGENIEIEVEKVGLIKRLFMRFKQ